MAEHMARAKVGDASLPFVGRTPKVLNRNRSKRAKTWAGTGLKVRDGAAVAELSGEAARIWDQHVLPELVALAWGSELPPTWR
jgi:hypothetical protein